MFDFVTVIGSITDILVTEINVSFRAERAPEPRVSWPPAAPAPVLVVMRRSGVADMQGPPGCVDRGARGPRDSLRSVGINRQISKDNWAQLQREDLFIFLRRKRETERTERRRERLRERPRVRERESHREQWREGRERERQIDGL